MLWDHGGIILSTSGTHHCFSEENEAELSSFCIKQKGKNEF